MPVRSACAPQREDERTRAQVQGGHRLVDPQRLGVVAPRGVGAGQHRAVDAEERRQGGPLGPPDEQFLGGRPVGADVEVAADVGGEAVGAADRAVEHVGGLRGEPRGVRPVGRLVAREVGRLIRRRAGVAGAREVEDPAAGMRAAVGGDRLRGRAVIEDREAVVHLRAGRSVVEVHVVEHLLAEVLHEPVGAEVERAADAGLPPGHRCGVGEVDHRAVGVEIRRERVRASRRRASPRSPSPAPRRRTWGRRSPSCPCRRTRGSRAAGARRAASAR